MTLARLAVFTVCTAAAAQTVSIYSEFTRIDPFGQPVRADRGSQPPREILSPAIPRNAYSSFHLVVEGRPGQTYSIQVAQNPLRAVGVALYRERYTKVGNEWVPDGLEPVSLPYDGRLGREEIPDQTAQAFWMDLLPDRNMQVRRIKVEPQVYMEESWVRYPMEVRIMQAALGTAVVAKVAGVDDISAPSSASAILAWTRLACGFSDEKMAAEPALTVRTFIARNAAQDVRLAGGVPPAQLLRLIGVADRAALCRGVKSSRGAVEEYLAVRDALIGARD